jgi:hypothetical protein
MRVTSSHHLAVESMLKACANEVPEDVMHSKTTPGKNSRIDRA